MALERIKTYLTTPPDRETKTQEPKEGITRRDFLRVTGTTAGTIILARAGQVVDFLGIGEGDFRHPLLDATSNHTEASMERTRLFVVGDSIGRGYNRDDEPAYSSGEHIRDFVNPLLQKHWDCTILAKNGAVIDEIKKQFDKIPPLAKGEKNLDLIISAGGNDFRRFLAEIKEEATEVYENTSSLITSTLDLSIMKKIRGVAKDYETKILPRVSQLHDELEEQGTNLNRVAFINLPDMSKTKFEIKEDKKGNQEKKAITYDNDTNDNGHWLLSNLGKSLPRKANESIGNVIWDKKEDVGADVLWLNAYGLPGDDLNGIHPTQQGQRKLGLQYLDKTFTPPEDKQTPHITLLAEGIKKKSKD